MKGEFAGGAAVAAGRRRLVARETLALRAQDDGRRPRRVVDGAQAVQRVRWVGHPDAAGVDAHGHHRGGQGQRGERARHPRRRRHGCPPVPRPAT